MSRKALFFDVDGTLISEKDHTIPESAIEAVKEARAKGHLAFINTGRIFSHLDIIRKKIPMDGYLCGCGTYLYMEGRVMYHCSIPQERYLQVLEAAATYRVDIVWEGEYGLSLPERTYTEQGGQFVQELRSYGEVCMFPWGDREHMYDKFCLLIGPDSDRSGFFRFIDRDFEVIDRGGEFYECIAGGHSKATAIEYVLKRYGIGLDHAYVFGDSTNDFPMFEYAANAVLMGAHDVELEPYASFITKRVEEDGIAFAMKSLKII